MSENRNISLEKFVARQPILDRRRNIVGYELLFRNTRNFRQSWPNKDERRRWYNTPIDAQIAAMYAVDAKNTTLFSVKEG